MPELHLQCVAARNLLDVEAIGKQDPYCKVSLGEEKDQTEVASGAGTEPKWEKKFVFNITNPENEELYIELLDKDILSSESIGDLHIPATVFMYGNFVDQWFPVHRKGETHGEINIQGQIMPELHLRCVAAKDLKDVQTFGTQDPYCKVTMGEKSYKTRVDDNGGREPVWNDKFIFTIGKEAEEDVYIEVLDKNLTDSEHIGELHLPVSTFIDGSLIDQWFPIRRKNEIQGEINLRGQLVRFGPATAGPQ